MARLVWALALIGGLYPSAAPAHGPTLCFTVVYAGHHARPLTKLAEQLQAKLGVPVSYCPTVSSSAAMKAFTNNDVQLAFLGGFMGSRCVTKCRARRPSRKPPRTPLTGST